MSSKHVNLVKLCVGASSVEQLETWQGERMRSGACRVPEHVTRSRPRRADEVLGGGSLYWVLDFMSFLLILLDREERRSVYDWIAGTVVVIGDLPPEEAKEASRSWVGELARALRGKAAPETR